MDVGIPRGSIRSLDPARGHKSRAELSLLRIMARTLLTYPAKPAPEGARLVPDIAASLPQVSEDLLTWTYTLKPAVMFGPPISRPVVCEDFKAAFERLLTLDAGVRGASTYFADIRGADSLAPGEDLEGVQCQDQHTLVFQLSAPVGDFAARTAMPAASPIPASENFAERHDRDYGSFLVSTGPYMWSGWEATTFSAGRSPMRPEGAATRSSLRLVRNPEWDESTDDVRKAYVDAIRVSLVEPTAVTGRVLGADMDLVESADVPPVLLRTFRRDPGLRSRLSFAPTDTTTFLWLDSTTRPFDDLHVRRAVNYVVDKEALRRLAGGLPVGRIANHIVPPTVPGASRRTYDPYRTPGHRANLVKAREAMRQSRYDLDRNGRCDERACGIVSLLVPSGRVHRDQANSLRSDLAKIGLAVRIRQPSADGPPPRALPTKTASATLGTWTRPYPDPSAFLVPLSARAPTWRGDPSVAPGDRALRALVTECSALFGADRVECWPRVEAYVMEEVVPLVPLLWTNNVRLFSTDVSSTPLPYDQFSGSTPYDQVFLTAEVKEVGAEAAP